MKIISVCIPVYNEESNIENAYIKIKDLFEKNLINYDYEIIFTDNHSNDKTILTGFTNPCDMVMMQLNNKRKQ